MNKINEFIKWAQKNGWKISFRNNSETNLPQNIIERYIIPEEYKAFLTIVEKCINSEGNMWFFCNNDYLRNEENSFRYNEFEIISLDAADGDDELINGIKNYWNEHLPIIFNVNGEYEYYAINIEDQKIVYGFEPEFEESIIVANNFIEFMDKIIRGEIKL